MRAAIHSPSGNVILFTMYQLVNKQILQEYRRVGIWSNFFELME